MRYYWYTYYRRKFRSETSDNISAGSLCVSHCFTMLLRNGPRPRAPRKRRCCCCRWCCLSAASAGTPAQSREKRSIFVWKWETLPKTSKNGLWWSLNGETMGKWWQHFGGTLFSNDAMCWISAIASARSARAKCHWALAPWKVQSSGWTSSAELCQCH